MKTRTGMCCLATLVLLATVLVDVGRADSAPGTLPCGHQGACVCIPNIRNYGYYPTDWRRWPSEVRRDEHFPQSLGRERIPTPPGEPTESLPVERVPSRPLPSGGGEMPVPDGILPPDGPFQPEIPILPEPALPGGVPPFVPGTIPGRRQDEDIPSLPRPAPPQSRTPAEQAAPVASPAPRESRQPIESRPSVPSQAMTVPGPAPSRGPTEPSKAETPAESRPPVHYPAPRESGPEASSRTAMERPAPRESQQPRPAHAPAASRSPVRPPAPLASRPSGQTRASMERPVERDSRQPVPARGPAESHAPERLRASVEPPALLPSRIEPEPRLRSDVPRVPREASPRPDESRSSSGGPSPRFEPHPAPAGPARGAPLRQPDAWMTQSHPRFDALRPSAPIEYGPPALQASHEAPEANTAGGNSAGAARPAVHDGPAAAKAPLALDGFCPVTLSNEERWQQGRREFAAVYQDRTFHMAGPEEHRRFLANPHRFAPMFGGVDPVLVVDQQRWTPGSIQYSVTYKGRIYMLSSEANLKQFHADPRRYAFEIDE